MKSKKATSNENVWVYVCAMKQYRGYGHAT